MPAPALLRCLFPPLAGCAPYRQRLTGRYVRLPDYILANIEPILTEWEAFARTVKSGSHMDQLALRDHAEHILRATVRDMRAPQTNQQQKAKSEGLGEDHGPSQRLDEASDEHAAARVLSGFDLVEVVSEYRALRASVIRLWRQSHPQPDAADLEDLTRFNESIDQSLTKAVRGYTLRVDRAREMFLAILGHDLRNPLNAMVVGAEAIEAFCEDQPEVLEVAAQINRSADVIARMIHDLLDYTTTRLGAGMRIHPQPTDLRTLCREVVAEYRSTHPTHELKCEPTGDLAGTWDPARLRQAVSNLVANAVQHGSDSAPIHLRIHPDGDDVIISVQNRGEVIPAEVVPMLFNPFVRGAANGGPAKARTHGFGLGLYIAQQVVAIHGGRIDVQSSQQDGTTFTIRLPRHAGVAQHAST